MYVESNFDVQAARKHSHCKEILVLGSSLVKLSIL